jgi:hypothetical protein
MTETPTAREQMPEQARTMTKSPPSTIDWHALAHRWLLEHNPLYLISAAAVLLGVYLLSDALSRDEAIDAELWLTAATEAYQALLIGGAALLYRRGQRRPAVMLALLEVVYLADLTCQTRVAAYWGTAGVVTSAAWIALFAVKLHALAWAVRLRPSWSARVLILLAGLGLATLPHALLWLEGIEPLSAEILLVGWLSAIGALAAWASPTVVSLDELDAWGQLVCRRALRATWTVWALLLLGHVTWWSLDHGLSIWVPLGSLALLLATRWARRESAIWALVAGALLLCGWLQPTVFAPIAWVAAAVLALRTWRDRAVGPFCLRYLPPDEEAGPHRHPYRQGDEGERPRPPRAVLQRVLLSATAKRRLVVGAVCCGYLALWTETWGGGAWPAHQLALDLSLCAVLLAVAWRQRSWFALLPVLLCGGDWAVERGVVAAPGSQLQWGGLLLGVGFGLLIVGLLLNLVGWHRFAGGSRSAHSGPSCPGG